MYSDKIQYNAPLPGEEFKSRDLSVPAEAAKVLYEVDSLHGEDKELCLAILARVFRGAEVVTKTLSECAQVFRGRSSDASAWRFQAIINRNIRVAKLESKMASVKADIRSYQEDRRVAMKKKEKRAKVLPKLRDGTPMTPSRDLNEEFDWESREAPTNKEIRKFEASVMAIEQLDEKEKEADAELDG